MVLANKCRPGVGECGTYSQNTFAIFNSGDSKPFGAVDGGNVGCFLLKIHVLFCMPFQQWQQQHHNHHYRLPSQSQSYRHHTSSHQAARRTSFRFFAPYLNAVLFCSVGSVRFGSAWLGQDSHCMCVCEIWFARIVSVGLYILILLQQQQNPMVS